MHGPLCDMLGAMETLVDLTYRGIAFGRRIKLAHVRPTSGFLELATPMPVGTEIALIADDGVTLGVTVTWVHEQVAGADRAPGMIVAPKLTTEPASAWWQARVVLPDDDVPKPTLPRTRPVTVRPRSHTQPTPPSQAPTEPLPNIIADLEARIAAAGKSPTAPPGEPRAAGGDADAHAQRLRTEAHDHAMTQASDHVVIDDGHKTMIMHAIDPASLDLDPGTVDPGATSPGLVIPVAALRDDGDGGEGDGRGATAGAPEAPEDPPGKPATSGSAKRKKRRTR